MPISVIIPSKDRPQGLMLAVASAAKALPEGGEIIVVDDRSMVPAAKVLAQSVVGGASVIYNAGPPGPSAARNAGVAHASRPIVLFLDDDDQFFPDYCRRILDVVNEHPDVGFGSSAAMKVKSSGRQILRRNTRYPTGKYAPNVLRNFRSSGASGLWVKRDIFLEVGGFDENISFSEDGEFFIHLVRAGEIMYYDQRPGVKYIRPRSKSSDRHSLSRSTDFSYRIKCCQYILNKHGHFMSLKGPDIRRTYIRRILKYKVNSAFNCMVGR